VFHRLAELQEPPTDGGVRGMHRRLYYRLLRSLERRVYGQPGVALAAVSRHTAEQLHRYFGRSKVTVIPNGVDTNIFHAEARKDRRDAARLHWSVAPHEHVLLLIGNDWRTKGLAVLLEAAALCRELPVRLLVVGRESSARWAEVIAKLRLTERVTFSQPSSSVLDFLAAADIYVAPSLEDSFNLPALEAMACGLPVIVSKQAGVSEWITDGSDGMVLQNPQDSAELADALRKLILDPQSRLRLGENAVRTAAGFSWDRHAAGMYALLQNAARRPL